MSIKLRPEDLIGAFLCSFGISEAIGLTALITGAGVGAETAGVIGAGVVGAGAGAAESAVTGGNIGEGALLGGLTGGIGGSGLGAAAGDALGIGSTAGTALLDAGAGAASSAAFGGNPLSGAALGAGGSLLSSAAFGAPASTNVFGSSAAPGGASAAGLAGGPVPGVPDSASPLAANVGVTDPSSNLPLFSGQGASGVATPTATSPSFNDTFNSATSAAAPSGVTSSSVMAGGASAAPAATDSGGFLNKLVSGAETSVEKNPLSLLAAAPLVTSALSSNTLNGQSQLTSQAGQLSAQGTQLQSYLTSGTLPPGVAQQVQLAQQQGEATIRSKYASMGQSGSSAEAADLANLKTQTAAQGYTTALSLFQAGAQETGISADIYKQLMSSDQQQTAATGSAIANFAAALAGTTPQKTTAS